MVPVREEEEQAGDLTGGRAVAQPGGWLLLTLEFWLSLMLSGCLATLTFVKSLLPKPPRDIAGHVVLVAGAASPLGSLISEEFARHGCCVLCLDQDSRKLKELTEKLRKDHCVVTSHYHCEDLTSQATVKEIAKEIREKERRLDVLVTCVGDSSQDIFDTASRTLMSHYWTTMAFLPWMLEQGQGRVIGVTPVASNRDAYLGSRVAISSLMESLGKELDGCSGRLTFVTISPVAESGRTAEKEREVAKDVVYASRTDRPRSTVNWAYELLYCVSGAMYSGLAILTRWIQRRGCDYEP